jgi:taurine dioxygenase
METGPIMSVTTGTEFIRLCDAMGIAVEGVDLHQPPDAALARSLRQALLDNLVLCIRGQSIGPGEFHAAISTFGTPRLRPEIPSVPGFPTVTTLSSSDRDTAGDGKRLVAGEEWHSDDTFMAEPCSLTCLYGIEVPETGGDTQFANMYAAYEALPGSERRRLDSLRVVHMMKPTSRATGRTRTVPPEILAMHPPVVHPLVRTHPETGRKTLYISRNRMERIVGMDVAEGHRLIDELVAHATQPQFCYRHKWRQGDIVIWDDRCTMHKANGDYPAGARRFMNRIIVAGDAPF